jgi:hypothetical protein
MSVAVYRVYPWSSVLLYNGVTLLHFGLGTAGLIVAYDRWPALALAMGGVYLAFALVQMYVLMPLGVCPSCVYRSMSGARCIAAMNIVSARITGTRPAEEFPNRGSGILCHNNLYLGSLIAPLPLMVPGLIVNFALVVLALLIAVAALLAFRFFVVFKRTACPHCAAKGRCPNAQAMGIG